MDNFAGNHAAFLIDFYIDEVMSGGCYYAERRHASDVYVVGRMETSTEHDAQRLSVAGAAPTNCRTRVEAPPRRSHG